MLAAGADSRVLARLADAKQLDRQAAAGKFPVPLEEGTDRGTRQVAGCEIGHGALASSAPTAFPRCLPRCAADSTTRRPLHAARVAYRGMPLHSRRAHIEHYTVRARQSAVP